MDYQKEIELIKERNKRVELDKAWETSVTRKIIIALSTYVALFIYMWAIGIEKAYLHAIVPTVGFLLSTFSLPFFRRLWENYVR